LNLYEFNKYKDPWHSDTILKYCCTPVQICCGEDRACEVIKATLLEARNEFTQTGVRKVFVRADDKQDALRQ